MAQSPKDENSSREYLGEETYSQVICWISIEMTTFFFRWGDASEQNLDWIWRRNVLRRNASSRAINF